MTRDETKKLIMIISASYPNYHPDNVSMTIDAWTEMLKEYSYQETSVALKAFITSSTSGFAPSIGELIEKIHMISNPEELNDMEAWALVSKAIRNGYYGAESEFEKLPPLVQKAVGRPSQLREWSQTDKQSIENVIQSNFIKTYRTVVTRAVGISKMPDEIKNLIEQVNIGRTLVLPQKDQTAIEDKTVEHLQAVPLPERLAKRYEDMKKGLI